MNEDKELEKQIRLALPTYGDCTSDQLDYAVKNIINKVREFDLPDHDIEVRAAYRLGKYEITTKK